MAALLTDDSMTFTSADGLPGAAHLSLDCGCRGMSSRSAWALCMRGMPPRTRPSPPELPRWRESHSDSLLLERRVLGDSARALSSGGLAVTGLMLGESLLGYACAHTCTVRKGDSNKGQLVATELCSELSTRGPAHVYDRGWPGMPWHVPSRQPYPPPCGSTGTRRRCKACSSRLTLRMGGRTAMLLEAARMVEVLPRPCSGMVRAVMRSREGELFARLISCRGKHLISLMLTMPGIDSVCACVACLLLTPVRSLGLTEMLQHSIARACGRRGEEAHGQGYGSLCGVQLGPRRQLAATEGGVGLQAGTAPWLRRPQPLPAWRGRRRSKGVQGLSRPRRPASDGKASTLVIAQSSAEA